MMERTGQGNAAGRSGGAEDGFTLTELVVATSLLLIVVIAGYLVLEAASGMADFAEAQSRVAEETRQAMDRMSREVRQAAELPGLEGTGVFSSVATSQVSFYSNVDGDLQLERVTYRRAGKTLMRSVTEPVIVDGDYTFPVAGPEKAIVHGLPADWNEPVFRIWSNDDPPVSLGPTQGSSASAISIHIRNALTVGRRTAISDDETWVKIRSVFSAVN